MTSSDTASRSIRVKAGDIGCFLAVTVGYVLTGQLGLSLAINPGNITAVWPASGLAFAAVLLRGTPALFGVWFGSFLLNYLFYSHLRSSDLAGFATAFAIAVGSTIQAFVGVRLLRTRVNINHPLGHPKDVVLFSFVAIASCVIAATVGVTSSALAHFLPWNSYLYTWFTWWAGDAGGVIVYGPLVWMCAKGLDGLKDRRVRLEFGVWLLALGLCCIALFSDWSYFTRHHLPGLLLTFPLLVWAAARLGGLGVALMLPIIQISLVKSLKDTMGPLSQVPFNDGLILMTAFMLVSYLIGFLLSSLIQELRDATERLAASGRELEHKVSERTAELQRANERLLIARDRAIEASHMKSAFVANISHELRTPLSGILGMTELILAKHSLDPGVQNMVETVYQSGRALLSVVNDILDLSKIESGVVKLDTSPFNPSFLVQDCAKLVASAAAKKKLKLNVSIDAHLPQFVYGDESRVRQVLLNLVGNAVKFTDQGTVTISAEQTEETGDYCTLQFLIVDTGIGISADEQRHLFLPFSQVDSSSTRRYEGTGLGLAISKRLVDLMQGKLWVESETGTGSTFGVSITFATKNILPGEAPRVSRTSIEPLSAALTENVRVLVVEDNGSLRELVSRQLAILGLKSQEMENGKAAVDQFRNHHFDLILLDIHLPDMTGYEVCRLIREHEKQCGTTDAQRVPIIALTAGAMEGDREAAITAGLDDYMAKPVHLPELRKILALWLERMHARGSSANVGSDQVT